MIGNIALKPFPIKDQITVSAGASVLYGGLMQNTKYVYSTGEFSGIKKVNVDSSAVNINKTSPRHYYGANAQFKFKTKKGITTECRAEFVTGKQTGIGNNTETPVALLTGADVFHIRNFNGAYF